MGFLRKIGKKIKKGVKKLMGGKFGKILGGIGLAMTFWGGANALFGKMDWFKNFNNTLKNMKPFGDSTIGDAITRLDDAKLFGGDTPLGVGEKIAKVGVETGKQFFKAGESIGETIASPFTKEGGFSETIADITEAGVKQKLISGMQGSTDEEIGGRGVVPPVGSFIPRQAEFIADMSTPSSMNITKPTDFFENLIYGNTQADLYNV